MLVAVEIDSVHKRYGKPINNESIGGFNIYIYKNDTYELYVLNSGIGELAAAAGTQLLISLYNVDMIINFGVVGGLTQEMAVTKACIVEKIVHYDFDISDYAPVKKAQYENFSDIYIPTSGNLLTKALEIAPELKPVVCASADKFVATKEAKEFLHSEYGADICEMESAAIALTCHRSNIPFLMIKTVSDSITGGAEEFHSELEKTSDLCLEIADRIIKGM